jgi:hypothetical protein
MPYPWTPEIGPGLIVTARLDDDETVTSTLEQFFDANADGIDPAERFDIVRTLGAGQVYRGGGGAAPEWSLERFAANVLEGRAA